MIFIHTIFCVIGHTACGKSTITRLAAQKLNMKVLKSYTTRKPRKDEISNDDADHTFIDASEVSKYKDDMVAYTDRVGYCNFMTKQLLMDSDFCIINPSGYYELKDKIKQLQLDINLVAIYITVPYMRIKERAKKRGDLKSWEENYNNEAQEFRDFEKSDAIDYRILNDMCLNESVDRMVHIVMKYTGDASKSER